MSVSIKYCIIFIIIINHILLFSLIKTKQNKIFKILILIVTVIVNNNNFFEIIKIEII